MSQVDQALAALRSAPRRWMITGAAGFIGSNLLESLLAVNQTVVGLDNFTTGKRQNLESAVRRRDGDAAKRFHFIEGDLRSYEVCREACRGVDIVLHQAAQVSVPASIEDPVTTHDINVTGFLNLLRAAREAGVRRVVYASSCAVYGDAPHLPLREEEPARPLSPYAASKLANEAYAAALAHTAGLEAVGLRYFNVFGPRQDPKGVYAAVIPLWISSMIRHTPVTIYGDGTTTRDFCHVANVVQANVLAALAPLGSARHEVVNVGVGRKTNLSELFELLRNELAPEFPRLREFLPRYADFRPGDIRHSHASIAKARQLLGFDPTHPIEEGLKETVQWFRESSATGG